MLLLHLIFLSIYIIIVVVCMVDVLMENRQPVKTMAWLMVLTFAPILGMVLYFFFGQNTRKKRLISQRSIDQLDKHSMLGFVEQRHLHIPEAYRTLIQLFTNQSLALPFKDNEVDIYISGYDFFPAFTSKVNYRNHRKLCVIDGTTAFIGGMNIARRYVQGRRNRPWRDTHLRIRGGAVYAVQRAFLLDWYFVDRTLITHRKYYPPITTAQNNCLAQVVTSSPIALWPDIMQGYVRILLEARHYVYIETPYFLPTEPILFAMRTAAIAGVDIKLMVPRKSDAKLVEWASTSYLREALEAGITICLYEDGFNHSKLLVCDDMLCTCGSTNVDFRSFENNFESNIFFYDRDMALRFKQIFITDLEHCTLIEKVADLTHRNFGQLLWESVVRLLSPLL